MNFKSLAIGSVLVIGSLFGSVTPAEAYVTCNSIGNYTSGSANTIGGTTFYNGYNSGGGGFSGSCSSYGCSGYSY